MELNTCRHQQFRCRLALYGTFVRPQEQANYTPRGARFAYDKQVYPRRRR